MKTKYTYPQEPDSLFEGAHPAHGYGGHAARSWGNYSTLTIHEVTALRFGMNPLTCDSFWEKRENYGTLHIGIWNDTITEIVRAVYAGEIRTAGSCDKITKDTLVFAEDVEKYFKSKDEECDAKKNDLTEPERKKLLELILGMAMHAYLYNPSSNRNSATGNNKNSICAGIQSVGLNVSDDTIRKYLNEAKDLFPDATPIKSKD